MFQMIGGLEKAGSGIPKILHAWNENQWKKPSIDESINPDSVKLEMSMVDMLPEWVTVRLKNQFGDSTDKIGSLDRIILATTLMEGSINNERIRQIVDMHPTNVTKLLSNLVDSGFLTKDMKRRWTTYEVPQVGKVIVPPGESKTLTQPNLFGDAGLGSSQVIHAHGSEAVHAHGSKIIHAPENPSQTVNIPPSAVLELGEVFGRRIRSTNFTPYILLDFCKIERDISQIAEFLKLYSKHVRTNYVKPLIESGYLQYIGNKKSNKVKYKATPAGIDLIELVKSGIS